MATKLSPNILSRAAAAAARPVPAIQPPRLPTRIPYQEPERKSDDVLTLPDLTFPVASTINLQKVANTLSNLRAPKRYFRDLILQGNREMQTMYRAEPEVLGLFHQLFPEVVASRGTTKDHSETWKRWDDEDGNDIKVVWASEADLDTSGQDGKREHISVACVGGPSSLSAGLMYSLDHPKDSVVHCVTDRLDSNHDGSASYYHQRDATPVYVNPVNRGPYCVWIDLYKRMISRQKLVSSCENNRHHVKISLNWANFRPRHVFTIFIPNTYHMITDIWLRRDKTKAKFAHVVKHACQAIPIVQEISQRTGHPVQSMLIHGKSRACYVGFPRRNGDKSKSAKAFFTWLNQYANIPFEEVSREGFGSEVTEILNFPQDGLISPTITERLQLQLVQCQSKRPASMEQDIIRKNVQMQKLLVTKDESGSVRANQIEWMDLKSKETYRTSIDRAFLSLGPSATFTVRPPKLTLAQHAVDCLTKVQRSSDIAGGYTPTIRSLLRHTANDILSTGFRGHKLLKDFIQAAGSSSVFLLGVDLQHTSPAQLDVFSRFVDGVNQHWTLMAQRDVTLPVSDSSPTAFKKYRFFAIQMTGGGNFPSRFVRPDYLLNLLHTTEKMYGLDVMKHAVYDVIQSRGCGRAVSAQNSIAFQSMTDNVVVSYALGGIGMTTLFPNGQLMVQMMEKADRKLTESTSETNEGKMKNHLTGIDYSAMIDEPGKVARMMGVDNTFSRKEKLYLSSVLLTVSTSLSFLTTLFW